MKTRAVMFTEKQKAEVVNQDVADPGPGEALVETEISLVSTGTECYCYRGEFDEGTNWINWVRYPFAPGYSSVGRVVAVGPTEGQATVEVGQRVFAGWRHCGHAVRSVDLLTPVPDDLTAEQASWSALSYITQSAVRQGRHVMGGTAVVIGLGPVGQLVTRYLGVLGLREVMAVDTVGGRLEMAARHGATATFEGSAADAKPFVLEHTDGELADVVYDATGHFSVLPLALPLPRPHGRVVLLGDSPHPTRQHLTGDLLTRQINIVGTHNASMPPEHAWWTAPRQIRLFYRYLQQGKIRIDDLISHRHDPEDAPTVYESLF